MDLPPLRSRITVRDPSPGIRIDECASRDVAELSRPCACSCWDPRQLVGCWAFDLGDTNIEDMQQEEEPGSVDIAPRACWLKTVARPNSDHERGRSLANPAPARRDDPWSPERSIVGGPQICPCPMEMPD